MSPLPRFFGAWRIGQRLAMGFGVVIALFMLMAAIAYVRIHGLGHVVESLVSDQYAKTVLAQRAQAEIGSA